MNTIYLFPVCEILKTHFFRSKLKQEPRLSRSFRKMSSTTSHVSSDSLLMDDLKKGNERRSAEVTHTGRFSNRLWNRHQEGRPRNTRQITCQDKRKKKERKRRERETETEKHKTKQTKEKKSKR